jgi:signal transduction histidine kinase
MSSGKRGGSSHPLLQIVFLSVLVALTVVCIFRLRQHNTELLVLDGEITDIADSLPGVDQIQILVEQLDDALEVWQKDGSGENQQALRNSVNLLTATLEQLAVDFPELGDDLNFQQLQRIAQSMKGESDVFPPPDLSQNLVSVKGFRGQLYGNIVAVQTRQARHLEGISRALVHEMAVFLTVFVLTAAVYMIAMHHLVARPIRNLASVAREVTSGELTARAELDGVAPITHLASDFNDMVAILVETLREEQHVAQELQRKTVELEEANRHKSHFLANVSHELKTPLNAIIGFADILAAEHHGELNEKQLDYTRRMHSAGEHLLVMISDLIDIARIDADAMTLQGETFDVNDVIAQAIDLVTPQSQLKSHTLTFVPISPALSPELDPRRFKQIIVNLLSNAVKFTAQDGMIKVAIEKEADTFCVSVADTGVGIAADDRERVFEDFVQLDSALHRQHEGTGIGLPLCRRLAEMMNGRIELDSEPGKGSTFRVFLPFSLDNGEPE